MSDNTKIEWADATINAVNGCSVVSPGCTNCYAMRLAGTRMKHHPSRAGLTMPTKAGPAVAEGTARSRAKPKHVWTGEVRLSETALLQPLKWKRPRRIFWNAHGDLFHENVPDEWIDRVFAVCALTPQHTHMILTKRSARMREYFNGPIGLDGKHLRRALWREAIPESHENTLTSVPFPLPNVWLGVSVEDQTRADERIPDLLATPAAVRFISAEPLLGPLNLNTVKMIDYETEGGGSVQGWESALNGKRFNEWQDGDSEGWPKLDWVIAGGESGPGARPMHPDWARSLRDQCAAAGVAFHFKQWGEWVFEDQLYDDPGDDLFDGKGNPVSAKTHWWPEADEFASFKVGKKRAGRLLDGRTHDEFPA